MIKKGIFLKSILSLIQSQQKVMKQPKKGHNYHTCNFSQAYEKNQKARKKFVEAKSSFQISDDRRQ